MFPDSSFELRAGENSIAGTDTSWDGVRLARPSRSTELLFTPLRPGCEAVAMGYLFQSVLPSV